MYLRTAYNYTRLKRLEFSLALMCKKVCFKNDKTAVRRSVAHRAYTLNATVNGGVVVELYTICYCPKKTVNVFYNQSALARLATEKRLSLARLCDHSFCDTQ